MRKDTKVVRYDAPIAIAADDGTLLVTCTFEPHANKVPLDQIAADMVMIAKPHGVKLPPALHLRNSKAARLVRSTLMEDFSGDSGETKLLRLAFGQPETESSRHVVLIGLGKSHTYCDSVVCHAFEAFFNHAIDEGAQTVLVPFVINPNGKFCLTHKATAYRLKSVLKRVAQKRGGLGRLQEIKIYSSPSAVKHIRQGLTIAQGECACRDNHCPAVGQVCAPIVLNEEQTDE